MTKRRRISQKELKARIARLKTGPEQYPPELLENRRIKFLLAIPPTGFMLGSTVIYKAILHGIRAGAAGITKALLLSMISVTAVGTLVVGYKQGWVQTIKDDLSTMVFSSGISDTKTPSNLDQTIAAYHQDETISPTEVETFTSTGTLTPSETPTPTGTLTMTSTFTPTPLSEGKPVNPLINPTDTPIGGNNGNHYGQTPTPPGKRTRTPSP